MNNESGFLQTRSNWVMVVENLNKKKKNEFLRINEIYIDM